MSDLILPPGLDRGSDSEVAGPQTLLDLLLTAIRDHVERLSIFQIDGLLMDAARANDKRPAYLKIATLDSIVQNVRGNDKLRDELLIIRIPREVVDWVKHPSLAPRIVTP